jgi:hypothetical protein
MVLFGEVMDVHVQGLVVLVGKDWTIIAGLWRLRLPMSS